KMFRMSGTVDGHERTFGAKTRLSFDGYDRDYRRAAVSACRGTWPRRGTSRTAALWRLANRLGLAIPFQTIDADGCIAGSFARSPGFLDPRKTRDVSCTFYRSTELVSRRS